MRQSASARGGGVHLHDSLCLDSWTPVNLNSTFLWIINLTDEYQPYLLRGQIILSGHEIRAFGGLTRPHHNTVYCILPRISNPALIATKLLASEKPHGLVILPFSSSVYEYCPAHEPPYGLEYSSKNVELLCSVPSESIRTLPSMRICFDAGACRSGRRSKPRDLDTYPTTFV